VKLPVNLSAVCSVTHQEPEPFPASVTYSVIRNCRNIARPEVSPLGGYIITPTSPAVWGSFPSCIFPCPFNFRSWGLRFGFFVLVPRSPESFFLLLRFSFCLSCLPNARPDLIYRVSPIGNWEKPSESWLKPKAFVLFCFFVFCFGFCEFCLFVFLVLSNTRPDPCDLPRIPSCGGLGTGNWEKPVARRRL
jgi:hypothetical protein